MSGEPEELAAPADRSLTEPGEGGTSGTSSAAFPGRVGSIDARIGPITLKDEFSDPTVDVSHERDTSEHEIVSGNTAYRNDGVEFVVQALGRRPPQIDITGWLTEQQAATADELVSENVVRIITARYTGQAVPVAVDIPYSRVYHDTYGWIFETQFQFLGISNIVPDVDLSRGPSNESGGTGPGTTPPGTPGGDLQVE